MTCVFSAHRKGGATTTVYSPVQQLGFWVMYPPGAGVFGGAASAASCGAGVGRGNALGGHNLRNGDRVGRQYDAIDQLPSFYHRRK